MRLRRPAQDRHLRGDRGLPGPAPASDQSFADLCRQPKNWAFLAAATGVYAVEVMLMHLRWYYLVRTLRLPLRFRDALRLGFVGYLFNLAPVGVIGGDLLKAVLLARQFRARPAQAVATVVADRVVGLYMLFVLASLAMLATGFGAGDSRLWGVRIATLAITAAGSGGLALLLAPEQLVGRLVKALGRLPYVGRNLEQLVAAVRMYRQKLPMLLATSVMSVGVHLLFVAVICLIGRGLYARVAPLDAQLVVVPVSAATGVIPLAIGPFEAVLEFLYAALGMPDHQGLIVALGSRILSLGIALAGVACYLALRKAVRAAVRETTVAPVEGDGDSLILGPLRVVRELAQSPRWKLGEAPSHEWGQSAGRFDELLESGHNKRRAA